MDELRPTVKMMQPATIKQAVENARLQALALEAIFRKHKIISENPPSTSQQSEGKSQTATSGLNQGNLNPGVYTNPNSVKSPSREQRRDLGLCYKCENFNPRHQCRKQLLYMEGKDEEKEEEKKVGIG